METQECLKTKEDCIERGYKIFNKECYDECPLNSEDKNNDHICECSYYFYNNKLKILLNYCSTSRAFIIIHFAFYIAFFADFQCTITFKMCHRYFFL